MLSCVFIVIDCYSQQMELNKLEVYKIVENLREILYNAKSLSESKHWTEFSYQNVLYRGS